MQNKSGIVYILTNPCLDGWIKIGMSTRNDVEKRIEELNSPSNMPLMFRGYAVYHVDNPLEVEKNIHGLIDLIDDSLHARETCASGKVREREFFKISPERAFGIFRHVAKLRGDLDCLELLGATDEELEEEEFAEKSSRRPPFRFSMVDIPVGAEITFINDETKVATVVDQNNHVRMNNGHKTTMSRLAARLMGHPDKSYAGPKFFMYEGEVLSDRRRRMEQEESERTEQED